MIDAHGAEVEVEDEVVDVIRKTGRNGSKARAGENSRHRRQKRGPALTESNNNNSNFRVTTTTFNQFIMMNVHVLRALRAQRQFPAAFRRLSSISDPTPDAAPSSSSTNPPKAAPEPQKKKSWQDFQGTPPQTPSKVHWALSDVYEIGGTIPRAKSLFDQTSDNGMPYWSEDGVFLKIRTFGGSAIARL